MKEKNTASLDRSLAKKRKPNNLTTNALIAKNKIVHININASFDEDMLFSKNAISSEKFNAIIMKVKKSTLSVKAFSSLRY